MITSETDSEIFFMNLFNKHRNISRNSFTNCIELFFEKLLQYFYVILLSTSEKIRGIKMLRKSLKEFQDIFLRKSKKFQKESFQKFLLLPMTKFRKGFLKGIISKKNRLKLFEISENLLWKIYGKISNSHGNIL